jgi:hypothetical protein
MKKKVKKDNIIIPRKAVPGIVGAVPLIAILLSKGDAGPLFLFLIGIGLGVFIGINWKK